MDEQSEVQMDLLSEHDAEQKTHRGAEDDLRSAGNAVVTTLAVQPRNSLYGARVQVMDEKDDELYIGFDESKLRPSGTSWAAKCLCCSCFALTWCYNDDCGCFSVDPNEEILELSFGSYARKWTTPGVHWSIPWGRELIPVSIKQKTVDLPNLKVLDANGNPLIVSAVLVYLIEHVERSQFAVDDADSYVRHQATATLRKIVSQFPYETEDESPSLKTHASMVAQRLRAAAGRQLEAVGASVKSFQLNEISYAPEIAAIMLKKQAAVALVQARKVLVAGCAEIAADAANKLKHEGTDMTDQERLRLVNNVLITTVADGNGSAKLTMNSKRNRSRRGSQNTGRAFVLNQHLNSVGLAENRRI